MSERTNIAWTDATWNPIRGTMGKWTCIKTSPGCASCYSEALNQRFGGPAYAVGKDVARLDEHALELPLHWRKPRRIFVCSMTDLFGSWVPDLWIHRVFSTMIRAPQHTYQILTKRAQRMGAYRPMTLGPGIDWMDRWPENVWAGVSVEDQQRADERIPHLLRVPAAVRFLSAEPLLERVDLAQWLCPAWAGAIFHGQRFNDHLTGSIGQGQRQDGSWYGGSSCDDCDYQRELEDEGGDPEKRPIQMVIVGGESGPGYRPMAPAWARELRDQCKAAGVSFFYKQGNGPRPGMHPLLDGVEHHEFPSQPATHLLGARQEEERRA